MLHRLTNANCNLEGFLGLAELAAETEHLRESSLELSLASLPAFGAHTIAPLGAVLSRITDRENRIFVVDVPWGQLDQLRWIANRDPNVIIVDEPLLHRARNLAEPEPANATDTRAAALPYVCFATTDGPQFYNYLDEHLPGKGLPATTTEFSRLLWQSLGEVFVNAETHSESRLGVFVCGQFYPVEQRLHIAIADSGITIPERVNRRFGIKLPPLAALRWVLGKGHTTKEATPGGLGLKQLYEFVVRNEGTVQIASGRAFWQFAANTGQLSEFDHAFPGTVVTLEVNTARWQLLPRSAAVTPIFKTNHP